MIDHLTIEKILNAANIVEVVSEFVQLRKRGVNFVGLCPFHDDRTPSFYVSPAKGVCKCFSCGEGGNVVHFIMKHEQLTYVEALKWLAKKYGIEIQERELSEEERAAQSYREGLFIINQWAKDYFKSTLKNHPDGQAIGQSYFRSRGIREDIIAKFELGYCTTGRDALAQEAERKGFKKQGLIDTGLCYDTEGQGLRDRFWGRVIFPVHTLSGKVVAFGGRVLSTTNKKVAKYVNSPESEIYHKSNQLYGIFQAKHAISKLDRSYLVEGYTDVLSMYQAGIHNVVASSGTALTKGQIRMIHRFSQNITVLYDGDLAGIKASLRGIDMLLEQGMHIKVLLLPDGEDPDSFAKKHTVEEFQQFIKKNEVDFINFKTTILLKDAGNDPIKRAQLISDIVQSISVIPEDIERNVYIQNCAESLNVSEQILVHEVSKRRKNEQNQQNNYQQNTKTPEYSSEKAANHDPIAWAARQSIKEEASQNNNNNSTTNDAHLDSLSTAQTTGTSPETTKEEVTVTPARYELEKEITKIIIKYGEKIFETEYEKEVLQKDGQYTTENCIEKKSVVSFIKSELDMDEIRLQIPLFRDILEEAYKCNKKDKNWKSSRYFMAHQDANISKLASEMLTTKYEISSLYKTISIDTVVDEREKTNRLLDDIMNTLIR
ncbi:MAG: DNA primase, partial [Bacteroidaceae bacterium]